MSSYIIHGGKALRGAVDISGSKNAALAIIAASMTLDGPCVLENVPQIADVLIMLDICRDYGAVVEINQAGRIKIDPSHCDTLNVVSEKPRQIRASYYLMGALLGRFHEVKLGPPGGCYFGNRPIDQHVKGFEALGASFKTGSGCMHISCQGGLKGDRIFLDVVSVGATINLILAACRAEGTTLIENAAKEPHIVDVANFLNTMGANIKGAGTDVIRIKGVAVLPGGGTYSVIPDQIEAGTFMIAAAATRGDVTVRNIIPRHMEPLSVKLEEMGVHTEAGDDSYRVWTEPGQILQAANFKTMPYPGFPTDMQPQTTVLLTTATGLSRMYENVWDTRFQYVDDLTLMGAKIRVEGHFAMINGPSRMTGGKVTARDLRAGAAMVLAGLIAEGETKVCDAQIVERGYERFEEKLTQLGADIWKAE